MKLGLDLIFWICKLTFTNRNKLLLENLVLRQQLVVQQRRIVHFNITTNPTSQWAAQQIIEAFSYDQSPKYLIRDRVAIYGDIFQNRVKNMGINEVVTALKSPWQNPYVERLIGSIRRECLDHVIIFNQKHLHRKTQKLISIIKILQNIQYKILCNSVVFKKTYQIDPILTGKNYHYSYTKQ